MELEEIPYRIEYRPGTQHRLPDYLSWKPCFEIDRDVNCDDFFEEKINAIDSCNDWMAEMKGEQRKDKLIQDAIRQLADTVVGCIFICAISAPVSFVKKCLL